MDPGRRTYLMKKPGPSEKSKKARAEQNPSCHQHHQLSSFAFHASYLNIPIAILEARRQINLIGKLQK